MVAKFEHNRKDIERLQQILKAERALEVTFEEAGNIWNNISRAHGGAGWLNMPDDGRRVIGFIQTTPGFTNYQEFMKEDLQLNDEEE